MAIARALRQRRRRSTSSGGDEAARARRPRRRVRLDNDARKAQLLALGIQAFSDRTYDEVSIDDIAKLAGISKGLLYHYFPTKRDLYVAGLRATADQLIAETDRAASQPLAPMDRIRAGLDAYLEHVSRHARPFIALMRGGIGSDPEVVAVIESVRALYMQKFVETTEATPLAVLVANPAVRVALRGWIGFVEAASLEWLARREIDRVALRDLLVEVLIATVRVAGGPAMASL